MTDYTGKCFCGAIHIKTMGEPLFTQHCHCEKCREVSSDSQNPQDKIGYSYTAAYLTKHFQMTSGQDQLEALERINSILYRCSQCKSLIYGISQDPSLQAGIGVNANNFVFKQERPSSFLPDKHIYYDNRIVDMDDDLLKYKDAPKEQFGSGELWEQAQ